MGNAAQKVTQQADLVHHERTVARLRKVERGSQIEDYAGQVYTVLDVDVVYPHPGFTAIPLTGGRKRFVPYNQVRDALINPLFDWDKAREAAKNNLLFKGKLVYHFGTAAEPDATARWFDAFKAEGNAHGAEIVTFEGQVYLLFELEQV